MEFYYLKAVHIVFVVTWFAGLFYLPRLMVYAAEASQSGDSTVRNTLLSQYRIMQKRLLYGISLPSAVITLILGIRLLMIYPLTDWLKLKLILVILLYGYHISLHIIFLQQQRQQFKYSGQQLRVWNEVPTVLLVAITFLAVFKNLADFWWGLLGLLILILLLFTGIRIYKYLRNKKQR